MSELVSIPLPGALPEAWFETARLAYADDPRWIPEDPAAISRDFHPQNPWFASARAHAFLVPHKARLCAFFDPQACIDGKPAAYFGDFVSTGDREAEAQLLERAAAWAREQGATELVGPLHMATWHSYRALVSIEPGGLPFAGEPYDAPGIALALTRTGFAPVRRYVSQILDRTGMEGMAKRVAAAAAPAMAAGYSVEAEDIDAVFSLVSTLYDQTMEIFRDSYAFTPPVREVGLLAMRSALRRACPHTTIIARDREGQMVGYLINFPHWGPLLVQGAKPRFRVAELDYAAHSSLLEKPALVLKTLAVLPQHQSSRVGTLMLARALEIALGHYEGVVCATMRDDNKSRRYGEGLQVAERWYALYARALA